MKKFFMKVYLAEALLLLLASTLAVAQSGITNPPSRTIDTLQKQHPFGQSKIADCSSLSGGLPWAGNELRYLDGNLIIRGTDKRGGRYSIVKGTGVVGCTVWGADLRGSGSADLEILTPGQDSSGGYDATLTVILFDKEGRPFPWQAAGRFTASASHGIDQVIAEGTTKSAGVIVPTKEGATGHDANYAFELYRFSASAVSKVQGSSFGVKWPMFVNATAALIKHREAASLTINLDAPKGDTQFLSSSNTRLTGSDPLQLANGFRVMPPLLLVEDSAGGNRVITLDPSPEGLARLVQGKAAIRMMGTSCEEEECRPMVFIAELP